MKIDTTGISIGTDWSMIFKSDNILQLPNCENLILENGNPYNVATVGYVKSVKGLFPHGITDDRPNTPIIGQGYFDTDLGYPIWYSGAVDGWVNATGASV